jgi:hypothetical protein
MRLTLLLADTLTVKSLADENLCLLTPGGPIHCNNLGYVQRLASRREFQPRFVTKNSLCSDNLSAVDLVHLVNAYDSRQTRLRVILHDTSVSRGHQREREADGHGDAHLPQKYCSVFCININRTLTRRII